MTAVAVVTPLEAAATAATAEAGVPEVAVGTVPWKIIQVLFLKDFFFRENTQQLMFTHSKRITVGCSYVQFFHLVHGRKWNGPKLLWWCCLLLLLLKICCCCCCVVSRPFGGGRNTGGVVYVSGHKNI